MKLPVLILLIFFTATSFSQAVTAHADIPKNVGKTITVHGMIYDGKYLSKLSSKPTFLDFGGKFPKQVATIVIDDSNRINFYKPEEVFKYRTVWITGKVSTFNEQYRITVTDSNDIKIDTTVPAPKNIDHLRDEIIFTKAEVEASFPGGLEAWKKFLENNLNPQVAAAPGLKLGDYTVKLQFVVRMDGTITDIVALNNPDGCYACISDAIRTIKVSPRWIPAKQNGFPVNFQAIQYITYQVSNK